MGFLAAHSPSPRQHPSLCSATQGPEVAGALGCGPRHVAPAVSQMPFLQHGDNSVPFRGMPSPPSPAAERAGVTVIQCHPGLLAVVSYLPTLRKGEETRVCGPGRAPAWFDSQPGAAVHSSPDFPWASAKASPADHPCQGSLLH